MLIFPNVGAEQNLSDTSRLEALYPFVENAMGSLFPSLTHQLRTDGSHPAHQLHRHYLPQHIRTEIAPNSVFAFINTPEVIQFAEAESRPIVGSPRALTFHSRDWLFRLQAKENTPWVQSAACFDFTKIAREQVIKLAQDKVNETPALQQSRTWKPFLSASGSGRCAGSGTKLGDDEKQFVLNAKHTGLILEPWVLRGRDVSSQYWLSEQSVDWLSSTVQDLSPAGRYRGLSAVWTKVGHPVVRIGDEIEEAHHLLAQKVWEAGYRGPLGIDGFDYHDRDAAQVHRICEINARLTMGHLLIGLACSQSDGNEWAEPQSKLQLRL